MKSILFITGTRADYGKLKPLMEAVEHSDQFTLYIYISGMHLLEKYGGTYHEVLKDGYRHVQIAFGQHYSDSMSYNTGNVICDLTGYVGSIQPDLIVVHGDRIDALAGAIVGALNNIRVAHIEGGEVSGTIDESIRHAVSKFAHYHFVSNEEARARLIQLGEAAENIHVIGSPDIDIMLSPSLPSIDKAKDRYDIPFDRYGILMYHPVTTEFSVTRDYIRELVDAVIASGRQYIVIYPNNDLGTEIILSEYHRLEGDPHFRIFPSIRFEYFLTFLRHAEFMIGNSSAGIRETCVYGIPSVDIGNRQAGRYPPERARNIQHVNACREEILAALQHLADYRIPSRDFGNGNSTALFMDILSQDTLWSGSLQKQFNTLTDIY